MKQGGEVKIKGRAYAYPVRMSWSGVEYFLGVVALLLLVCGDWGVT